MTRQTPLISIIIPAYNSARTLAAAVRSAIHQTLSSVEVIVVDDGSTDRSADVIQSIGDSRVRLVHQANRGQSAALNAGVKLSRGHYIKFLDADDWINPQHLESQLGALKGFTSRVASCRWGYFTGSPDEVAPREQHVHRDYGEPLEWLVDSLMLDEGMMGGWMWLIPRQVWDFAGGWDETLSLNNDFDFSVRLLLASSGVMFAKDALYAYRKGVPGALSATNAASAMQSAFSTTESGCRHLLARDDSQRIRRICADRWQSWLYRFYPDHPHLAEAAEREIQRLGGSSKPLEGGVVLHTLLPVLGWKRVRRIQSRVHKGPWRRVLRWKEEKWVKQIGAAP